MSFRRRHSLPHGYMSNVPRPLAPCMPSHLHSLDCDAWAPTTEIWGNERTELHVCQSERQSALHRAAMGLLCLSFTRLSSLTGGSRVRLESFYPHETKLASPSDRAWLSLAYLAMEYETGR